MTGKARRSARENSCKCWAYGSVWRAAYREHHCRRNHADAGRHAKLLPNAWLFLGVWVLGGAYALLCASSMADVGSGDSTQRRPI